MLRKRGRSTEQADAEGSGYCPATGSAKALLKSGVHLSCSLQSRVSLLVIALQDAVGLQRY
jgi:hypothetical protein